MLGLLLRSPHLRATSSGSVSLNSPFEPSHAMQEAFDESESSSRRNCQSWTWPPPTDPGPPFPEPIREQLLCRRLIRSEIEERERGNLLTEAGFYLCIYKSPPSVLYIESHRHLRLAPSTLRRKQKNECVSDSKKKLMRNYFLSNNNNRKLFFQNLYIQSGESNQLTNFCIRCMNGLKFLGKTSNVAYATTQDSTILYLYEWHRQLI